jgi:hypothetical protein
MADSTSFINNESDFAFAKVHAILGFINSQFSLYIRLIYLAVGANCGKSTKRYLVFIPFYNPTIDYYNFMINHPFVFARGYAGVVSNEFYDWLDRRFVYTNLTNKTSLEECIPIMVANLDDSISGSFFPIDWRRSVRDANSLSLKVEGFIECSIHDPLSLIKTVIREIIADKGICNKFQEYLEEWKKKQDLGDFNRSKFIDEFSIFLNELMKKCSIFSFPTIQIAVISPMTGLVPFPVKDIRIKIAGMIDSIDKHENDVYISVEKPVNAARLISFQRIWNTLIVESGDVSDDVATKLLRGKVFMKLGDL